MRFWLVVVFVISLVTVGCGKKAEQGTAEHQTKESCSGMSYKLIEYTYVREAAFKGNALVVTTTDWHSFSADVRDVEVLGNRTPKVEFPGGAISPSRPIRGETRVSACVEDSYFVKGKLMLFVDPEAVDRWNASIGTVRDKYYAPREVPPPPVN